LKIEPKDPVFREPKSKGMSSPLGMSLWWWRVVFVVKAHGATCDNNGSAHDNSIDEALHVMIAEVATPFWSNTNLIGKQWQWQKLTGD